jgi:hypothetical protein
MLLLVPGVSGIGIMGDLLLEDEGEEDSRVGVGIVVMPRRTGVF